MCNSLLSHKVSIVQVLSWNLKLIIYKLYNPIISQFWPYCIKIVNDVNIIIKSWWGAQGQGPAIDVVFYVSKIKIDSYGSRAS